MGLKITHTVELDFHAWSADPLAEANEWVGKLGADVDVAVVTLDGPAGGNPVMSFTGTKAEIDKVLVSYFEDMPDELAEARAELEIA